MKKIIFLLSILISFTAQSQCVIDGTTYTGTTKARTFKSCDAVIQSLSDGLVKSHGDSLKTAIAGVDYGSLDFTNWSNTKQYATGNTVIFGNLIYTANTTPTLGNNPGGNSQWTLQVIDPTPYTGNASWSGIFRAPTMNYLGEQLDSIYEKFAAEYFYNVKNYGVTGNGSTNDAAAINTLIGLVPAGSTLYFPAGTYLTNTTVTLSKTLNLLSFGSANISVTSNIPALTFGADGINISGINFSGSTSGGAQNAIYSDGYQKFRINNCEFKLFGHRAIELLHTESANYGGVIDNCVFLNNYEGGIYLGTRAEFVIVSNCTFNGNIVGIEIRGGNDIVTGCNINYNSYGVVINTGTNNAHGILSNNNINHNTNAIQYFNATLGFSFVGNHIYQGDIYIYNSTSLDISGGILAPTSWHFENSTNINIHDNTMSYDYGNTVTNNYNSTIGFATWINNRNLDGSYNDTFNNASFRVNQVDSTKIDLLVSANIQSAQYRLSALNTAPSSSSDTGVLGEIRITASYIYVCTAINTWVRSALATW